jgi:hypothetical protein
VFGVRARIGSVAFAAFAALAALSPSPVWSAPTGNVGTNWYAQAFAKIALTPNYSSGFGPILATFGTAPSPSPQSGACLQGCAVDFGTVIAGDDYLYKFATHINIQTNDVNGVNLYGEGAADFFNQNDSSTLPLNTTVYYLPSTSGGADANTGFSPAFPFYKTAGTVSGNSFSTAPSITYTAFPAPIAATMSAVTSDLYYDYQLKIPVTATTGAYYVWIVYTVVPK